MHRVAMVLDVGGGHAGEPAVRAECEAEHVAQEDVAAAAPRPDSDGLPDRRWVLVRVVVVALDDAAPAGMRRERQIPPAGGAA
jgi:hypothetical protein